MARNLRNANRKSYRNRKLKMGDGEYEEKIKMLVRDAFGLLKGNNFSRIGLKIQDNMIKNYRLTPSVVKLNVTDIQHEFCIFSSNRDIRAKFAKDADKIEAIFFKHKLISKDYDGTILINSGIFVSNSIILKELQDSGVEIEANELFAVLGEYHMAACFADYIEIDDYDFAVARNFVNEKKAVITGSKDELFKLKEAIKGYFAENIGNQEKMISLAINFLKEHFIFLTTYKMLAIIHQIFKAAKNRSVSKQVSQERNNVISSEPKKWSDPQYRSIKGEIVRELFELLNNKDFKVLEKGRVMKMSEKYGVTPIVIGDRFKDVRYEFVVFGLNPNIGAKFSKYANEIESIFFKYGLIKKNNNGSILIKRNVFVSNSIILKELQDSGIKIEAKELLAVLGEYHVAACFADFIKSDNYNFVVAGEFADKEKYMEKRNDRGELIEVLKQYSSINKINMKCNTNLAVTFLKEHFMFMTISQLRDIINIIPNRQNFQKTGGIIGNSAYESCNNKDIGQNVASGQNTLLQFEQVNYERPHSILSGQPEHSQTLFLDASISHKNDTEAMERSAYKEEYMAGNQNILHEGNDLRVFCNSNSEAVDGLYQSFDYSQPSYLGDYVSHEDNMKTCNEATHEAEMYGSHQEALSKRLKKRDSYEGKCGGIDC